MNVIVNMSAKAYVKCVCCGGNTRRDERYLQVFRSDGDEWRPIKGERYCVHCEKYARVNNEVTAEVSRNTPPAVERDDERGLRLREEYAAYQAVNCASSFFDDLNAGYIV
jgi:hypothetical protein